jgi:superfamily II DNA/RNA helicase
LINPFFIFLGQKGKVDKDKEASKRVKDRESGVARGIDFQFVANVINFDFPKVFLLRFIIL